MWQTRVFKVLNLLGMTHPFFVCGFGTPGWIETGDYDRILRGEYSRMVTRTPAWCRTAGSHGLVRRGGEGALVDEMATAARRMGGAVPGAWASDASGRPSGGPDPSWGVAALYRRHAPELASAPCVFSS